MMLLACVNQMLSLYAGAALVMCAVQLEYFPAGGGGGKALPMAVRGWWYLPWAWPALLLLATLAAAGTTARTGIARVLLALYGVLCILCACAACAAAAWAAVELHQWLESPDVTRELAQDRGMLAWLRPFLPLLAPDHINTMFAEAVVRSEIVGVLCAGAALPLLLLVAGVVALCSRPPVQLREPCNGSSRSNSLHYESTSLYKIPLHDSAIWQ